MDKAKMKLMLVGLFILGIAVGIGVKSIIIPPSADNQYSGYGSYAMSTPDFRTNCEKYINLCARAFQPYSARMTSRLITRPDKMTCAKPVGSTPVPAKLTYVQPGNDQGLWDCGYTLKPGEKAEVCAQSKLDDGTIRYKRMVVQGSLRYGVTTPVQLYLETPGTC